MAERAIFPKYTFVGELEDNFLAHLRKEVCYCAKKTQ